MKTTYHTDVQETLMNEIELGVEEMEEVVAPGVIIQE